MSRCNLVDANVVDEDKLVAKYVDAQKGFSTRFKHAMWYVNTMHKCNLVDANLVDGMW
jgi:hypothetical protein